LPRIYKDTITLHK